MSRPHPATLKAELRRFLGQHPVVTTMQLERWGWAQAADWLDLPRLSLDVRTQVTQPSSQVELTFVAHTEAALLDPPHVLLHSALLAETWAVLNATQAAFPGEGFRYVSLRGRGQGRLPDAEIQLFENEPGLDSAVEVDTGYPPRRCHEKLHSYALQGFSSLVWATTVHGRVTSMARQIETLQRLGQLPGVREYLVLYVNVSRPGDPYRPRPRGHKLNSAQGAFDGL